jgi:poly(3-hydroxybutyrate) depolymerase
MLFWLGCAPDTADSDDTDVEVAAPQPAELAPLSSGECPDLSDSGSSTLMSNGIERTVQIFFPAQVKPGLPVLYVWHPLGANATQMARWLDLEAFASENDVIVVVPESDDNNLFDWGFRTDGLDDLTLFDDVRTCLSQELEVDLSRVYATGFSAGALWTTFLAVHRGNALAAVMVMSGGTDPVVSYLPTNGEHYPTLLMWGGDDDTWGNSYFHVDFADTTDAYRGELLADGHFVTMCNHGLGHDIPAYGRAAAANWLLSHRYGEASPWVSRDPTEISPDCFVAE